MRRLLLLMLMTCVLSACHAYEPTMCETSDDCFQGELCRYERCVVMISGAPPSEAPQKSGDAVQTRDAPPTPHTVTAGDTPAKQPSQTTPPPSTTTPPMEASSTDNEQPPEEEEPATPFGVAPPEEEPVTEEPMPCGERPQVGDLVINEILVNVPKEDLGDVNGDGNRDAYEDEFVELVNITSTPLDLGGVSVASNEKAKLTFPMGTCLQPFGAIVIFGGPSGAPAERWGDVLVLRASARFGFSNSSGSAQVLSSTGATLFALVYDAPPMASFTLSPELYGAHFVSHETHGSLYSPGLCADGSPLSTGCEPDE